MIEKTVTSKSIAIVHDWLLGLRGGERCLQAFLCLYEDADVFALFYRKGRTDSLIDSHFKKASWINSLPGIGSFYRLLLPLFPFVSSIPSLRAYTVRLSLSHAASKNMRGSSPDCRHVCYCFTPMRYIWDQAGRYLGWKSVFAYPLIAALRIWDKRASSSVSDFIAISRFVSARIRKYYARRSHVIYPPVSATWLEPSRLSRPALVEENESAYLFAGALVPYKGAELAIRACAESGKQLWVAGTGPESRKLIELAGKNLKFLGKVSDAELGYLLVNCKALIFPCKEDFGILPLEAQAAGKPVIALYAGACKETIAAVRHWLPEGEKQKLASASHTGVFIRDASLEEAKVAIEFFEKNENAFSSDDCIKQAQKFSPECFYDSWRAFALQTPGFDAIPMVSREEFVFRFNSLR